MSKTKNWIEIRNNLSKFNLNANREEEKPSVELVRDADVFLLNHDIKGIIQLFSWMSILMMSLCGCAAMALAGNNIFGLISLLITTVAATNLWFYAFTPENPLRQAALDIMRLHN